MSLNCYGYALNRIAVVRHEALALAMWYHGPNHVLACLEGIEYKGAYRTYYSDAIDYDIKFIRDYMEPPMPSPRLIIAAFRHY